jgi:tRNA A37 threonylcarbamoyladenosine dehydratase
VKNKAILIAASRVAGLPIVTVGGGGGRTDPSQIKVADLARTYRDGLLQNVRKRLRQKHDFPKRGRKPFGVPAVFSSEPILYPKPDGTICTRRPGKAESGGRLSCETGVGAATFVTGAMGFTAASVVVNELACQGEATERTAP